jgi:hypothetical protein
MEKRFQSFEEFWPYYVREHSKKLTRQMHFVGTTLAVVSVAGALFASRRWLLLGAPFAGYGPAWISHFFIERNRPATFSYPLWSLQADFVMWSKMLAGTMHGEVERVLAPNRTEAQACDVKPTVPRPARLW